MKNNKTAYSFDIMLPYTPTFQVNPKEISKEAQKLRDEFRLINTKKAAELLGVAEGTLMNWRSSQAVEIPFVRIGARIRYRLKDVKQWIKNNRVIPEGWRDE